MKIQFGIFIIFPGIWYICQNSLWSKELIENPLQQKIERYLPYPIAETTELEKSLDFNPRNVTDTLSEKLNKFYLSDPSRKKIQQRQDIEGSTAFFRKEWNVNIQRLFMRDLLMTPQKNFLIKEAPNIYAMHYLLAKALVKQSKPYHAAFHFAYALRYRSMRLEPGIYTDNDRLKLLEQNNPEIKAAQEYKRVYDELAQNESDLRKARAEYILNEDRKRKPLRALTGGSSKYQEQLKKNEELYQKEKERGDKLIANLTNKNKELQSQKTKVEEDYKKAEVTYNKQSAVMLVETAQLVRELEDSIKERLKVLNKKALYKTNFNQTLTHDYSQNRQFTAFANLLEAANRLDEKNPMIPFMLAEEYRTSQDKDRAIYAYNRALEANKSAEQSNKLDDQKIEKIHLSLGGLYSQKSLFVDSAWHYEEALKKIQPGKARANLLYQTAKLHNERTGNFSRSLDLLAEFKQGLDGISPSGTEEKVIWLKDRFHTHKFMAFSHEKLRNYRAFSESLAEAKKAHEELEQLIADLRKKSAETWEEMQKTKKPLLEDTTRAELNEYLNREGQYQKQKNELAHVETVRNSLPLDTVYFAYAKYLEGKRNIEEARNVLRQAELAGIAPDVARRELQRINSHY